MKKKLISSLLASVVILSSTSVGYASEVDSFDKDIPNILSNYRFDDEGIVPMGNWRYRKETYVKKSLMANYTKYVTEEEAIKARNSNTIIGGMAGLLINPGGPLGVFIGVFNIFMSTQYKLPFEWPGKYVVKVYTLTKYEKDRLTGRTAIRAKGYEFQVTHNGKTHKNVSWTRK